MTDRVNTTHGTRREMERSVDHWRTRAEKAEAEVKRLREPTRCEGCNSRMSVPVICNECEEGLPND